MAKSLRRELLKRILAWTVPIAVILGGGLWYFGTYYDWVEDKTRTGMTGEARKNRFYAAELLLKELGVGSDKLTDTRKLLTLPPDKTLILPSPRALDKDQARRLAQWVDAGGHLVLMAATADELSRALGVYVAGSGSSEDTETVQARFDDRTLAVGIAYVTLLATEQPLRWSLTLSSDQFSLRSDDAEEDEEDDETDASVALDSGHAVINFSHGRGYVTAMGGMGMLTNHFIGRHDNAEFLVRLAMLAGDREVFIAPDPQFPNLIEWLWEHAWPALIALGVLLVAWLWHAGPRFGPLEPIPPPARPGLREHLSAVGEFHLKGRDFDALLTPLRDECVRSLQLHAAREGHSGQAASLASRYTGLTEAEIERALRQPVADRSNFLYCAATLARIRDALISSNSTKAGTI